MTLRLPFEIKEAIIQACGRSFWYRDPLRSFFIDCGVPPELYDRFSTESKFKIARHVLEELEGLGEEGFLIQRRLLTSLCDLRDVPDQAVPDRDAAVQALRAVKELARDQKLYAEKENSVAEHRAAQARRKQASLEARAEKMEQIRTRFASMVGASEDPQMRGYGLEDLLAELFRLHEITYRPPYRTANEQIDGHFEYKGFDYLVEARWRQNMPAESDLAAFTSALPRIDPLPLARSDPDSDFDFGSDLNL